MEKHRIFQPVDESPKVSSPYKTGLIVSQVKGRNVFLKDIIRVSQGFDSKDKQDHMVLFGYLWDADLHMRCLAYAVLAHDLGMTERLPPIRILNNVGGPEFREMCAAILSAIEKKYTGDGVSSQERPPHH